MQGFLNLHKPLGLTSHDCVARVRRWLRLKRVGHAGTLDPAASGVLPIAVGRATRLLQFLPQDKAYRATIRLGLTTTTDDLEGEVLTTQSAAALTLEAIKPALSQFLGQIQQIPPNYSAIQVQGKRLYNLARAGISVTVEPRTVEIFSLDILDWRPGEFPELDLEIACGAGTYIRAIARDLGQALGTGGTLAALSRTRSSGFEISQSITLEDLELQAQQNQLSLTPAETALAHLAAIVLPATTSRRWCQGQRIALEHPIPAETIQRVHHENGQFLGIGRYSPGETGSILSAEVVLEPNS